MTQKEYVKARLELDEQYLKDNPMKFKVNDVVVNKAYKDNEKLQSLFSYWVMDTLLPDALGNYRYLVMSTINDDDSFVIIENDYIKIC